MVKKPDKTLTPGDFRFVWKFMETKVILTAGIIVGLVAGAALGWLANPVRLMLP